MRVKAGKSSSLEAGQNVDAEGPAGLLLQLPEQSVVDLKSAGRDGLETNVKSRRVEKDFPWMHI